jgi:DNA-binding transcriptional MerR regulator/methylmalonyl-CoA mutase cobalamin-binding subunit
MDSKLRYPIRYVARATGLKPYLIRTWEGRYAAVCPHRTPTNRRMYTDREIRRLKLLQGAVAAGHALSAVAGLSDDDLEALVARTGAAPKPVEAAAESLPPGGDAPVDQQKVRCGDMVRKALSHVSRLDAVALERVLTAAAVEFPRHAFLQQIVVPLFEQIGALWKEGRLKIVNEHMASAVVRAQLWEMLRTMSVADTAPTALIATPPGHWHECGALASALAAAESGWRVLYYGPNLPAEEIAYVVKKMKVRVLILSLSHRLNDGDFTVELEQIRRMLGDQLPILVGGTGVSEGGGMRTASNAEYVKTLGRLRRRLEEILTN